MSVHISINAPMPVSQTYSAENKENSEISTAIISIHVKIKDRIYLLVLNVNVLWTTIHENTTT